MKKINTKKMLDHWLIMVGVAVLLVSMAVMVAECRMEVEWTTHVVAPGETMWGIAKEYNPGYGSDVRVLVQMLAEKNGKDWGELTSGELVLVPVVE